MYLIFDTETSGLPHNKTAPIEDLDNWPRLVQLAWQLHKGNGQLVSSGNYIIYPDGFSIPFNAEKIHGISTEMAREMGNPLTEVLDKFIQDLEKAKVLVGHNINFDNKIVGAEFLRMKKSNVLTHIQSIDTATETIDFCQLKGGIGGKLKIPKLIELYEKLFGEPFEDAHDAAYDVNATAKIFFECLKRSIIPVADNTVKEEIRYESPVLSKVSLSHKKKKSKDVIKDSKEKNEHIKGMFCHLHGHSQYSVLQATPKIEDVIKKAKDHHMPAVAITDLGNMFCACEFESVAHANGIKPILGCEFFVAEERTKLKFTKDNPDKRFRQVLLAKTKRGYQNLIQLSTIAYKEGNYGLFPRIDKDLIKEYSEDLIALSGGLQGEIPKLILNVGENQAEEMLLWWKSIFKEDFYLELNRHGLEEEDRLNSILLEFANKHTIKYIAANEFYYLNQTDAEALDVLLCIKENEKKSTPVGRGRGYRLGITNQNYYFKSQEEMKKTFSDFPKSIENISEILNKVEDYELKRPVLLPKFNIPSKFINTADEKDEGKKGENEYLKYLTYLGAEKRYGTISQEIKEKIEFELDTIAKTKYPGYFLIVKDVIDKAKEMGIAVGPGRGSAAGSIVAYCTNITNVDPIRYDLLFERFLNPDRVSLPDIDIDFDNEGREKIIQYVVDKYGMDQVAQIITYGFMAPKSAIRDAGRVMELPLQETGAIANLVPEKSRKNLKKILSEVPDMKAIKDSNSLASQVLNMAIVLEGSLRNIGVHPCGVIIAPENISNFLPLAQAKDSALMVTQFDSKRVSDVGMLKIDFLGIKTLSIIKTAINNVKKSRGIEIDIDNIPLDDVKTYELYQKGQTKATFQFESAGMQKYLKELKPNKLEDLIAMNALYRPGPMSYIPNFIARKQGRESINYDLPDMEEYLSETYGITVYQEQVMRLSQKLAGFSKGEADTLRSAMGKKQIQLLKKLAPKFLNQAKEKGYPENKIKKIWKDWESFAEYAFNKSHSTGYAITAYQTAYLKAHYPEDYMAAVLTYNQDDIDQVSFFMQECLDLGIKVLGPHINESLSEFTVNDKREILFGMSAIKGTGASTIQEIIEEREENGAFKDIFDFAKRVNLRSVNKKSFESLAKAGAFDYFKKYHRRQYIEPDKDGISLTEKAIRFATQLKKQEESSQTSLFDSTQHAAIRTPQIENIEPYSIMEKLKIEQEILGIYISGHPLDPYKFEIEHFSSHTIHQLNDLRKLQRQNVSVIGMLTNIEHKTSRKGTTYAQFTLEDLSNKHTFYLFSKDYDTFKSMLKENHFVFVTARIQNRWNSEELEVKIVNIQPLKKIRDQMVKGLELQIKLENINANLIDKMENLTKKYSGKMLLKFVIQTEKENRMIKLETFSKNHPIHLSNELMNEIKSMDELSMKIIRR